MLHQSSPLSEGGKGQHHVPLKIQVLQRQRLYDADSQFTSWTDVGWERRAGNNTTALTDIH